MVAVLEKSLSMSQHHKPAHAQKPIIIVGAGWAGLSCAFELVRQNKPVILLEAAPQAGGRARSVLFGSDWVDNGQHLLMGAYEQTRSLLRNLQIPEEQSFVQRPFEFYLMDAHTSQCTRHLSFGSRTDPLSKLYHLYRAKGFSMAEKLTLLKFFAKLETLKTGALKGCSVAQFLKASGQSPTLIQQFWNPLVLAALSTPAAQSSAQIWVQTLKAVFAHPNGSQYFFPRVDLTRLLPTHILEYLSRKSTPIYYHQRVQGISLPQNGPMQVHTAKHSFEAQAVVLATPPLISRTLLQTAEHIALEPLIQSLGHFHYQPIATTYIRFQEPLDLAAPLIGLLNASVDWIFDRRLCGQPHMLSAVMSARAVPPDRTIFIERLQAELKSLFPHLSKPVAHRIIHEKQAVFSCDIGVEDYRPSVQSALKPLLLAGDYTQNPYPATLEGAVYSGIKAAKLLC